MAFDFLTPVADKVIAHCELLPSQALGKKIYKHTKKEGLPVLAMASIAIIGVNEARNAFEKKAEPLDLSGVRLELYKLMVGNWNSTIIDLGDVEPGEKVSDTYFVVKEVIAGLIEENIVPIVIGPTQDLTYPCYRAFDGLRNMINLVNVDSRFDFGDHEELISSHSYMSKIITDKPNNLFNFSNIGYQSYFNSQEEIDLMERLFFDAYRLGEVTSDITLVEPILRNAHIVSLDARAVRASEMGMLNNFSPNGFTGREICAIARYAGISEKLAVFGVFESENSNQSFQLVAQIIWYFIEGYNFRVQELPYLNKEAFTKYIVPSDLEELVFYKSNLTERWWVEVPSILNSYNKNEMPALLPCTKADYVEATNQNIPERWFKAFKKGLN
ncbi:MULTISPECIES: formimidoylglutamase [Cellulophaga]|uniref:Arginase/agmatinase/formiminoglutamase n=2 Tax=Cellulophaga TaxID=104264 RepID=F0RCB5_CELLC|nr:MULTISPECIES: formimidoylglutamase [Cellulophaga]ADY28592.1 Arginase/agmatinase/formiminoglutamase [Cellulophaga lytica DSM 7489]APU09504.1 arginase [Cellulophaga lytica]EWH12919.1 Arginase/agmatinase/formiminoglutamase [Cellulophaga geojensis KL-A]TVZ08841.1 arginase family enzyme [Cellulophaga sp. RHA_52]WQG77231.1 formimidoylglutamase [Cellulophaga lytica]